LADALDLGSSVPAYGFESLHPHHTGYNPKHIISYKGAARTTAPSMGS
jgi:hypothetical protein